MRHAAFLLLQLFAPCWSAVQGSVYWTESTGLYRRSLGPSSVRETMLPVIKFLQPTSMLVVGRYLLWGDWRGNYIANGSIDMTTNTFTEHGVLAPLTRPNQMAWDATTNRLYYDNGEIYYTSLSNVAQGQQYLSLGGGFMSDTGVAVDGAGKLYVMQTPNIIIVNIATGMVLRNFTIQNIGVVSVFQQPVSLHIGGNGRIYWYDSYLFNSALLDGTNQLAWPTASQNCPYYQTTQWEIHVPSGKLYWVIAPPTNGVGSKICRANLDGTSPELLVNSPENVQAFTIDSGRSKLIWADYNYAKLMMSDLNGTNQVLVNYVNCKQPSVFVHDEVNQVAYVVDAFDQTIYKTNMNFTAPRTLVASIQSYSITSMVVDPNKAKLYYSVVGSYSYIGVVFLNNGSFATLDKRGGGGLAIDLVNQFLYWCDSATNYLWRISTNGSGEFAILQNNFNRKENTLATDFLFQYQFWSYQGGIYQSTIPPVGTVNYNSILVATNPNSQYTPHASIFVDPVGHHLYYSFVDQLYVTDYWGLQTTSVFPDTWLSGYTAPCFAVIFPKIPCAGLPPGIGVNHTNAGNCTVGAAAGSNCTLGCDYGFGADPIRSYQSSFCVGGDYYPTLGQCRPVCPDLPTVVGTGYYTAGTCTAGVPATTKCNLQCIAGRSMDPTYPATGLQVTCLAPNGWSNITAKCNLPCPSSTLPSSVAGTTTSGNLVANQNCAANTSSGTSCYLKCTDPMSCDQPQVSCSNGNWNVFGGCAYCCPTLPPGVGLMSSDPMAAGSCGQNLLGGLNCATQCRPSFIAVGSLQATCSAVGTGWSGPTGSCVPNPTACFNQPDAVVQGTLNVGNCQLPSPNGTKCTLACTSSNQITDGSLMITCLNGNWTHPDPCHYTLSPTTKSPTLSPTVLPLTSAPTRAPTTSAPTSPPTTNAPTTPPTTPAPTFAPTTIAPTAAPTTLAPTAAPTTLAPTSPPTTAPTSPPTLTPTAAPTLSERNCVFPNISLATPWGASGLACVTAGTHGSTCTFLCTTPAKPVTGATNGTVSLYCDDGTWTVGGGDIAGACKVPLTSPACARLPSVALCGALLILSFFTL